MDFFEMSVTRDSALEDMVLCGVISRRMVPVGFRADMFTRDARDLAAAIIEQWETHHQISFNALLDAHMVTVDRVMTLNPDCSEPYLTKLREYSAQRAVGCAVVGANTSAPALDLARSLQEAMSAVLLGASVDTEYDHPAEIQQLLKTLEEAALSKKEIAGTSTGIPELDAVTNGFEKGKFYLIGALKKTGKSRFMVHCAVQMSIAGHRIFLNSLEMSRTQLLSCALAWCSDISTSSFGATMKTEEYKKMAGGFGTLADLNWCVYREKTVAELRARIHQESVKSAVDYVFVDFLQRMRAVRAKDRVREVEEIAMDLADLSRDLNVGVIALCQLSGEAEKLDPEEIPNMQHIKESQAAAENADTIMTMHNPNRKLTEFTNGEYKPQPIFIRVEQRYGLSGRVVATRGDLRTCRFSPEESFDESSFGVQSTDGQRGNTRSYRDPSGGM